MISILIANFIINKATLIPFWVLIAIIVSRVIIASIIPLVAALALRIVVFRLAAVI